MGGDVSLRPVTVLEDKPTVGLSSTAEGDEFPSAWERARSRLPDEPRWIGWGAPILVTLLALGLRLYHLGRPRVFAFDETYYAKDAWSLLNNGYVRSYLTDADGNPKTEINADILAGHTHDVWTKDPSMIVHPEVGKWMIALGEKAFGMDPFGWRIAAAVTGALMVLVMCRLVRRLTGSTMLGCVAGFLLMFDGLHFVLSRLALLDIFLAFWLLCAVACIVNDRDWHRAKLARLMDEPRANAWGPIRPLLFRPWLILGGVCFGLALGTKWSAVYPLAALGALVFWWSSGARVSFGLRWARLRAVLSDGVPAFVQLVVVAGIVYAATWTGWMVHAAEYERTLSSTQYTQFVSPGKADKDEPKLDPEKRWPTATEKDASGVGEVWQSLRSLASYHHDLYIFHTQYLNEATHPYQSQPSGWLLLNKPVGVAADTDIKPGEQGCTAQKGSVCYRQVLLLGNPVIWWGGIIALIFGAVMWLGTRDWRYQLALVGTASTWLPWLQYDDRPIFLFYAIAILPFLIIAISLMLGKLIGADNEPTARRTFGVVVAGSFFVLALLSFAWFWPIYTNELLTRSQWLDRIWFSRWI